MKEKFNFLFGSGSHISYIAFVIKHTQLFFGAKT